MIWTNERDFPHLFYAQVNIVNIGNVATEIQSASRDNVLATGVTATLLASDGV